ncbi:MAG: toll/interleukin-1 receptor domain-containing protein [Bryobacteraceae bacterium]
MLPTAQISPEVRNWLNEGGFENLCFISYPHVRSGSGLKDFASRIRESLLEELELAGANPNVFIDHSIPPGSEWPRHLKENLGQSVAMVAILAPLYFTEDHGWCGKEWAAMTALGQARHPNSAIKPIIPVLFRETSIPAGAGEVQYVDLSRVSISGRRYYSTEDFRRKVLGITGQVLEIARHLYLNRSRASDGINFPILSPFQMRGPMIEPAQPPPLRAA